MHGCVCSAFHGDGSVHSMVMALYITESLFYLCLDHYINDDDDDFPPAAVGYTGVWVDDRYKIAAIGLKIRRWVTMHGVSINVHPDMRYFENIVPCGITDKEVGSIKQLQQQLVDADVNVDVDKETRDRNGSTAAIDDDDDDDGYDDDDNTLYRAVVRELIRCFLEEFDCDVHTLLADEQALSYLRLLEEESGE